MLVYMENYCVDWDAETRGAWRQTVADQKDSMRRFAEDVKEPFCANELDEMIATWTDGCERTIPGL